MTMHPSLKTAVIGTTSDYIDLLRKKRPGKLLFITSPDVRQQAYELSPEIDEELICDIKSPEVVLSRIRQHLLRYGIALNGVACFDCESMLMTAHIAEAFDLPYHSLETINACRDKSITRMQWDAHGIGTPESRRISSAEQAVDFFRALKEKPCVLKPLDGSGSERVFYCSTEKACQEAYHTIRSFQYRPDIEMETYISGTEYSCDFFIYQDRVFPIRFSRKITSHTPIFGTTTAYELIEFPQGNISQKNFPMLLMRAAKSLGITKGICMVDFIITEDGILFLEMTPRPGGDCLPWLIKKGLNIDILSLNIEIATSQKISFAAISQFSSLVGLRIHAHKAGLLKYIDTSRLTKDPRVMEVLIKQQPKHQIQLPPKDYDSWNLGHIIFKPSKFIPCKNQCEHLLSMLDMDIEADRRQFKSFGKELASQQYQFKEKPDEKWNRQYRAAG